MSSAPADPELAALTILANDEAVQNWYRPSTGRDGRSAVAGADRLYIADLALRGLLVDADVLDAVRDDTAPALNPSVRDAEIWSKQSVLGRLFRMTFD